MSWLIEYTTGIQRICFRDSGQSGQCPNRGRERSVWDPRNRRPTGGDWAARNFPRDSPPDRPSATGGGSRGRMRRGRKWRHTWPARRRGRKSLAQEDRCRKRPLRGSCPGRWWLPEWNHRSSCWERRPDRQPRWLHSPSWLRHPHCGRVADGKCRIVSSGSSCRLPLKMNPSWFRTRWCLEYGSPYVFFIKYLMKVSFE